MQVDVLSPSTAQPPSFHPRSQRRRQNNGGRRGGNGQRAQAQDSGVREPESDTAAHQQNAPRRVFTSTGTGVVSSAEALTSSNTSEANQTRRGDGGNGRHGGSRRRGGRAAGGDGAGRERNTREPQNNGTNRLTLRDGASASANDVTGDEQHARHAPRRRRPKIALTGDSSNPASEPASTVEERPDDRKHNKDKRNRRASPPPVSIDLDGLDDLTATLIEGLTTAEYECMICYDTIRQRQNIWSCAVCYAVFHLNCAGKWGRKSAQDHNGSTSSEQSGWCCPGCRTLLTDLPSEYRCFCNKTVNPHYSRYITPHTCGQTCGRDRNCPHPCTMPCHPGPCRPCEGLSPPQPCFCGRSSFVVRCSELGNVDFAKSCGEVCGKELNCGNHHCERTCHSGPCSPCSVTFIQSCACGKTTRELSCGAPPVTHKCHTKCDYPFACGVHRCERICHAYSDHSPLCPYDPDVIKRCPCGAQTVEELTDGKGRTQCQDDIPTCGNICNKVLPCGHRCHDVCHTEECPPCQESISLPCRCGGEVISMPCVDLKGSGGEIEPPLCNRSCNALRHCKRHRCKERCCPQEVHVCDNVCAKNLRCGQHTCTFPCGHPGRCHDCVEGVSFDELACHCGRTRMYPPIPCGTRPPICTHPCIRPRTCEHTPLNEHHCHPDSEPCPPCVFFVSRRCTCGKTEMKNIPCHRAQAGFVPACGESCLKTIPTCGHTCVRFCHTGDCVDAEHPCASKCGRIRSLCGHQCGFACHGRRFCAEDRPCAAKITQSCRCGHKTAEVVCAAWKENAGNSSTVLPCDDSCAVAERNRRLADALNINTGEASASTSSVSGTCEFDEKLLRYAKDHPSWAQSIEKSLASFVQDQSKRVHHFPQMKPAANVAAAALAAYYGLIGEVVDAERGQGSVLIRKTAAKTPALPAQLLSAAASSYKPAPSVLPILQVERGNASSLAVQTSCDGPINALCITSLQFGMDARDVQLLLEPLVGSDLSVNVRLVEHDAIAVFTGVRHGEDDIAAILVAIQPDVKSKFLDNNWAKDVKCCSAVVDTSAKSKPKAVTPIAAPRAVHLPWRREVPVANGFGVLETEQASPPNPTTPSPVLSLGRPKTPDAWDDVDE